MKHNVFLHLKEFYFLSNCTNIIKVWMVESWRGGASGIYVIPTLKFACVLKLLVEQLSSEFLSLNVRCVGTSLVKRISLYLIEITAILLCLANNGEYAVIISNIAVETKILLLAD